MDVDLPASTVSLHGHQLHYVTAGSGPVLVLLHGLLGSRQGWAHLMSVLAQDFTLVAPDLFGHGESAKPLGDYSLGAHAGTLRDLMETLDVPSATIVGHSLGGGVAMQFAYLFPERCERLLLVSSGGLGREISLLLRAPTLPGSEWLLPLVSARWLREGSEALGRQLRKLGLRTTPDIVEEWRGFSTLGDAEARRAFLATIRTVVGPGGQTVDAHEKIYLFEDLPVLLVWGAGDRLIPVRHAVVARQAIPGSRLEVFEDAGHFPHLCDPERFAKVLRGFIHDTSPRRYDPARWRAMLAGAPPPRKRETSATDDYAESNRSPGTG
jgi:pimeloyl-ACP methyl ester carboxylesterase